MNKNIDDQKYEDLILRAEQMIAYEKQQCLESGLDEECHYTYRIVFRDNIPSIHLYTFGISLYKNMTTEELNAEIKEIKEELEELQEEFEDLESGWSKDNFDTDKEYKERLEEVEDEIFSSETTITLIENILQERG